MIQRWKRLVAALAATTALVLGVGTTASATDPPGVYPSAVSQTMLPGDSISIHKVVQTDSIPPNPDLVFLADTTGSMASPIANVKANAIGVMNTVLGAQPTSYFGAASYKDFNCDAQPYRVDAGLSANTAATQAGINSWSASGGCDEPEAQLNALTQVANGFAWRPGSSRVIAWFGDAPGHDPSNGATLSSTIAALQAQNIRVIAISTGADRLDLTGQATAITTATGGAFMHTGADVAGAILAGLSDLPAEVGWNVHDCTSGLNVALTPATQTVKSGDAASFDETVSVDPGALAGSYSCTVSFSINGVPGGAPFDESISITVPAPDLSIAKTGPAAATEGNDLNYNLVATNNGPTTATGVTISDPLPANSTFVSASPGCAFAAGAVTCSVGTLAPGASQSYSITLKAGSGGSVVNTASIGGLQNDPNDKNNSSSVTTTINHNPICTGASAGPSLWPPNHALVWSSIAGVTDPDGDPVSVTITGIWQDEPTSGLGSGDTPVDGVIGAGNSFAVRAERSGLGDGRVYHVLFSASDGLGGSCTGAATIGVPHDQSATGGPVDGGALYNSTL